MRNRVAPIFCWIAILGLLASGMHQLGDAGQTSHGTIALPQKTIEYVEWKRSDPPFWLEAASKEDIDFVEVRKNLMMPVKLKCEKKPLSQALKLIEAQIEMRIRINTAEFSAIGIDPETPITVEASGNLQDVLELTLQKIEPDVRLSWRLMPYGLLITSFEDCEAEPVLRTFDLAYFLPDASHANELMSLVMTHVDPDSWLVAGGTNVISVFGSQMIVSAPYHTTLRIEKLLAKVALQDRDHLKAPKYKEDACKETLKAVPEQRDSK